MNKKLALAALFLTARAAALPHQQNLETTIHLHKTDPCKLGRITLAEYKMGSINAAVQYEQHLPQESCPETSKITLSYSSREPVYIFLKRKKYRVTASVTQNNPFGDGFHYYHACLVSEKDTQCTLKLVAQDSSTPSRLLNNPFAYPKDIYDRYGSRFSPCEIAKINKDPKYDYSFALRCGLQNFSSELAEIDSRIAYQLFLLTKSKK